MTPESQPQNIEGLLRQAEKVNALLNKAHTLLDKPGGPAWPERFQVEKIPDAIFFDQARETASIAEKIRANSIPSLTKRKQGIAEQQVIIQTQQDIKEIEEQVNKGNLSREFLEKGRKIFAGLKAQVQQPIPAAEPAQVEAAQILATSQLPEQAPDAKEMLEIPGFSPIERKPLYTSLDFAVLIGTDRQYAGTIIWRIKNRDTRIQGKEERVGKTRTILYTKQELLWLAEDYAARPKRSRRSVSPTAKIQALPEPEKENEVADVKIAQETSIAPVQDTLTFQVNGKEIAVSKKDFYTNEDVAAAIARDKRYVSQAVQRAKINNPTIATTYLKTNYGEILKFDEENFIKIVTDIMSIMRQPYKRRQTQAPPELGNNNQNETTVVPLDPQETNAPEATIVVAENPGAQIVEEETIFVAGTPKPRDTVVLEKEETIVETPVPALEISNEGYLILDGIPLEDLDEIEKPLVNFFVQKAREGETTSYDDFRDAYIQYGGNQRIPERHVLRQSLNTLSDKLQQADYIIANTAPRGVAIKAAFILRKGDFSPNPSTGLEASRKAKGLRTEDLERIKQEIATDLTLTISSNFAHDNLGNVTTRPESLLNPLLPPETTLEELVGSRFRKETDRFFVDSLVGKLEGLQEIKDLNSLSVKDRQILENLRVANRDLKTIIQAVCRHFLVPIPKKYSTYR